MCKRGRKCLSGTDEPSVSINLRLPVSAFDRACRDARRLSCQLGEEISLPEYVRRSLPGEVNEEVYGPWDGSPPMDSRYVDAVLDYINKRHAKTLQEHADHLREASDHLREASDIARKALDSSNKYRVLCEDLMARMFVFLDLVAPHTDKHVLVHAMESAFGDAISH